MFKIVGAFICFFATSHFTNASDKPRGDSTYYVSYSDQITSRVYLSRKFTALYILNKEKNFKLDYEPNTTLNLGVGATYKSATLNLAYGFGFLNPERGRGETKYLDMQFHSYGQKIVLDVLAQFYKGFYLEPKGYASSPGRYYVRPDLDVDHVGISAQYLFNNKRLSYKASFLQNALQKRTAGSFLVGLEAYAGRITGDSSFIPSAVHDDLSLNNEKGFQFFEFGPNLGYVQTFVIAKHFFITGALTLSVNYSLSEFTDGVEEKTETGFSTNSFFRFFTGYNSNRWGVSFIYINNGVRLSYNDFNRRIMLNTGNFRVNYIYRFSVKGRLKRFLDKIP